MTTTTAGTPPFASDPPLPYQSAAVYVRPANAWAGAAIVAGGLGLTALGGCFLVGVLAIVSPQVFLPSATPAAINAPQGALMTVLYVLAFTSFAGAAAMLFVGTRGLLKALRG